jgi:alpha-tubulin suppressor-like RCC1 family protein
MMRSALMLLFGCGLACSEVAEVLGEPPLGSASDAGLGGAGGAMGMGGSAPSAGEAGAGDPPDAALGFTIAAGDAHSCTTRYGLLYCWGEGSFGRLGLGDVTARSVPARVGNTADFVDVAAATDHTCARKYDGSVWCFGRNNDGQLGATTPSEAALPVRVELTAPATRLSSTASSACAVLANGELHCWGYNVEGGLGLDDTHPGMNQFSPVRVGLESDWREVGAGQGHTCGVRGAGVLFGWGRNTAANLGLGSTEPQQQRAPVRIGGDEDWLLVESGQDASCGIRTGGALYCWGENQWGTLGTGDRGQRLEPAAVALDATWIDVSLDTFHACGVTEHGGLYCWGRNLEGQLGTGDLEDRLVPELVGEGFARVAVGRFHTCAISSDARVFCTGENGAGRLGLGHTEEVNVWSEVLSLQ